MDIRTMSKGHCVNVKCLCMLLLEYTLGVTQKIMKQPEGEVSTNVLHIVRYILRRKGCFIKYLCTADTHFENSKSPI